MKKMSMETEEELRWIKDYMLLTVLLDVLERDIKVMGDIHLKMSGIYIQMLNQFQDNVSSDMAELRSKMRNRGIRIYDQRRTKERLEADFLCRGYHRQWSMFWGLIKSEVEQKLLSYLKLN
ncbi:hypothetical protein [Paenibacillus sp. GYB003]|uniref:hypothetical protein n=1 Tax=Paenibacillus sp. GYB003 TaxID=2994392 RepID=UPI002F968C4A